MRYLTGYFLVLLVLTEVWSTVGNNTPKCPRPRPGIAQVSAQHENVFRNPAR